MPTILLKKNDTPGAVPGTANLTNLAGGAEVAVNTADRRLFSMNSSSAVVELGTNPSSLTCADASFTVARIGSLTISSLSLTNVTITSATVTTLTGTSANITTLTGTSANITTFSSTSATIGTLVATADSRFTSTGALLISKGTTGEQPGSPVTGMLRYNTTNNQFEGYSGSSPSWKSVGGAAVSNDTSTASDLYPAFLNQTTGTAENVYTSNAKLLYKPSTGELKVSAPVASNGIVVNSTTVAASYTIASGTNGFSVGPITVNSGVTLTVASGQRHVVI